MIRNPSIKSEHESAPLIGKSPEEYQERILVAVTGLTPQIITETLYALCVSRTPTFVPTRIMLITTAEGAERARLTLLHPSQNHFGRFCVEYGLEGKIAFGEGDIHVIQNNAGHPLSDIRTPEDNAATANTIVGLLRQLTQNNDTALHVSIAGGRKTMGFYVGYALSLYGRAQDRLSHVLVTPAELESNREFYYPPKQAQVLHHHPSEKPVSTEQAVIHLAEIPFVRMRHGLPDNVLREDARFESLVDLAQQRLGSPELVIELANKRMRCGNVEVTLPPQLLAFYYWIASLRQKNAGNKGAIVSTEADVEDFLSCYRTVAGSMSHDYEACVHTLKDGMDYDFFQEKVSRINTKLRTALGPAAASYKISRTGKRPLSEYGLTLKSENINLF